MNATDESAADREPAVDDELNATTEGAADDLAVSSVASPPDDAQDEPDATQDEPDEPFVRYQNSVYRLISMGGAALIAVLGITGFAIGKTLDPAPPSQFFLIDGILAVVLFGWYLLGMRCRLDVAQTWIHVATKYGDFRIDRAQVVSIDADRSVFGSLQWSGRPLVIAYRPDADAERVKVRKAFGCLPNDARSQANVVEELQDALGKPDDDMALGRSLEDKISAAVAGETGDDTNRSDIEAKVAERLATMDPQGDRGDGASNAPDPK